MIAVDNTFTIELQDINGDIIFHGKIDTIKNLLREHPLGILKGLIKLAPTPKHLAILVSIFSFRTETFITQSYTVHYFLLGKCVILKE